MADAFLCFREDLLGILREPELHIIMKREADAFRTIRMHPSFEEESEHTDNRYTKESSNGPYEDVPCEFKWRDRYEESADEYGEEYHSDIESGRKEKENSDDDDEAFSYRHRADSVESLNESSEYKYTEVYDEYTGECIREYYDDEQDDKEEMKNDENPDESDSDDDYFDYEEENPNNYDEDKEDFGPIHRDDVQNM